MNIKITGKDLKATDAIKDYTEKKLERIQKYFDEEIDVNVTIRVERSLQIAEMHVKVQSRIFRAVTEHKDLYAAIDKDIDILEGQIRKEKTRREKINKDESIKTKGMPVMEKEVEVEDEILKTLYYDLKPMAPEDAKLKLQEMYGNIFFTFINIDTGKVNVIFKLKDGKNFGIVEPAN